MELQSTNLNIREYYESEQFQGSILESVRKTLTEQGAALKKLGSNLNEVNFQKALGLLYRCRGHIIVSGMGKSGLIGRKICATLASTGTPSFFIHPGEAFHGDLGMITRDDVVVLISNSGETDEVLQLIPSLKNFGNSIVSICNNTNSTLAINSDAVLDLQMDKETCPNNLAPTTSTTLTLAIGDALAIALMNKRGFKPNDFAKYHPGGSLGRKLLTKVKDVMVSDDLPFVKPDLPISEVIITMTNSPTKGLAIVIDENSQAIGVICDGDIRRLLLGDVDIKNVKSQDIMTKNPHMINCNEMISKADEYLNKHQVKQILVCEENGSVIGVLDIYRATI
ncbi:KpsF/GutQ family sugar-phosphate isomerase [Aliagarivorans marinus]|uniref:KpsF/GutQ family sugar-phosphate isomerase n=1 Tax=Aliagarivorans marinus TaxID=561965 RepID=UPI00041D2806|nr:KpsF/GutQ family sugar-phosphate isomerase [Aliagarivorans marinus]